MIVIIVSSVIVAVVVGVPVVWLLRLRGEGGGHRK